jgi:hypothetical protein
VCDTLVITQKETPMVRTPTLAELSLDLSEEIDTFKTHLQSMTRCGYAIAVGGSMARINSTVSGDCHAGQRFTNWVQDRLSESRLAFRSHFRQALLLAAAHAAEFEKSDLVDRPADECFYVLLAKHESVSRAAERAIASGCGNLAQWWDRFDDPVPMLELMALLLYPTNELKNSVRCFGARCRQLDGGGGDLLARLQEYSNGDLTNNGLRTVQSEYRRALDSFYKFDFDANPSCEGAIEAIYGPLINICDPGISWDELCSVTQRICRQTLNHRAAGRTQLANTMRRWISNPWTLLHAEPALV